MPAILDRAVLSTKEAHGYVGGRPVWEELVREFPSILKPFRRTPQGWEYWLVNVIDTALKAAQMDGRLLNEKPR